jgi:hypothetical protein
MKPQRSSRYLAWIRMQPCVVCGATRGIEAAHTVQRPNLKPLIRVESGLFVGYL